MRRRLVAGVLTIVLYVVVVSCATVSTVVAAAPDSSSHGATFVVKVFQEVLGRTPSPSEQAQALTTSMSTSQGRRRLVDKITTSGEWYFITVDRRYRQILGRAPDLSGLGYWVNSLASTSMTVGQMDVTLLASTEFAAGGSDQSWVDRLYHVVLGRPADPAGLTYWAQAVNSRGRAAVANDLYRSSEASERRVQGLFGTFLGRSADPSGLAYWSSVDRRIGELEVARSLASSDESYGPIQPGEAVLAPPPLGVAESLTHNGLVTRLVTVESGSWSATSATLTAWQRTVVGWTTVMGPYPAWIGSRGWGSPDTRREGDGTTPAGRYRFGVGFGLAANPGYRLGWFVVDAQDYWTSDPTRSDYNSHQRSSANPALTPWTNAEHLIDEPVAYRYAAFITFNSPPTGPFGSAIFLHVSTGGPTAGCVSLDQAALVPILRWIDSGTQIVMGPDPSIQTY